MRALALALATVGGIGYVPLAPGTAGSLVALPFVPALGALRARSPATAVAVVAAVLAAAIWSAGRAEEVLGGHDSSRIVVDEVAGLALAALLVPATWGAAGLVFVLFRVFDVVKPFPAGLIDRRVRGGVGVVADDLVAAAYAALAARVILGFPW